MLYELLAVQQTRAMEDKSCVTEISGMAIERKKYKSLPLRDRVWQDSIFLMRFRAVASQYAERGFMSPRRAGVSHVADRRFSRCSFPCNFVCRCVTFRR